MHALACSSNIVKEELGQSGQFRIAALMYYKYRLGTYMYINIIYIYIDKDM